MPDLITGLPRLEPAEYYAVATTASFREYTVNKMRHDGSATILSPTAVARELLYHATCQNPELLDAVFVVRLLGGLGDMIDVSVATPLPGRRLIRLLYLWQDIEPHVALSLRQLSAQVLARMATPGGVLRARVRHVRREVQARG